MSMELHFDVCVSRCTEDPGEWFAEVVDVDIDVIGAGDSPVDAIEGLYRDLMSPWGPSEGRPDAVIHLHIQPTREAP